MANNAAVFLIDTRKEARNVDEGNQRNIERIAGTHETCALLCRLDIEDASKNHRLIANDADGFAVEASETTHDGTGPTREVLEEITIVDNRRDDLLHVIRNIGTGRHDVDEFRTTALRIVVRRHRGRSLEIVRRKEREEVLHVVKAGLLVRRNKCGHTGLACV